MPEPTATMSPTPCARVPDRAIGGNAVDASDEAFLERARADAAAAAMRKHKHRKQRSARRVAASATLLAIDEATSIDTRAPTARVTTITSVATLTRDDAPPGALQRVMSRTAPNGSRSRAPILASSSAPASARAAISPRPAPQPPSIPSHTPATASSASSPRSFATTSPSSVSRTVASSFEDRTSTSNVPRAPSSCIPPTDGEGARGASDFSPNFPTTPTNG